MLYRLRLERSLREIGMEAGEIDRLHLRTMRRTAKAGRYTPQETALLLAHAGNGFADGQMGVVERWIVDRKINPHRNRIYDAIAALRLSGSFPRQDIDPGLAGTISTAS